MIAGPSIPTLGIPHLDRKRVETLEEAVRAGLTLPPFLVSYIKALEFHVIQEARRQATDFAEKTWEQFAEGEA